MNLPLPGVRFFTRNVFRKDITLVILLKIIAIYLLWALFFAHPVTHQLTRPNLIQHYLVNKFN
jgi:hypothetical protein